MPHVQPVRGIYFGYGRKKMTSLRWTFERKKSKIERAYFFFVGLVAGAGSTGLLHESYITIA